MQHGLGFCSILHCEGLGLILPDVDCWTLRLHDEYGSMALQYPLIRH